MTRLFTTVLAGTALLGVAAANASTITQSFQYGPQLTDYTLPNTFNLFDSNLGTLNDVVFSSSYGFTSTIMLTSSGSPSSGSVKSESLLGLTSSNSGINTVINNDVDTNGNSGGAVASAAFDILGRNNTYTNFTGTRQFASNASTQSFGPVTDTAAADLQPFQAAGGGTFDVIATTYTITDLSNTGGNTSATQTTTATATFTVAYDYTPTPAVTPPATSVPEPKTLAIVGLGLLGAGLVRKHRA